MGQVVGWGGVRGEWGGGDNPGRWKGCLDHLLPRPRKVRPVTHMAALPFQEVPALVARLREVNSTTALALEFLILVSGRRGEILDCVFSELDFGEAIWTVPAWRMKAGLEHQVPLVPRAMAILKEMQARTGGGGLIFPGMIPTRPLGPDSFTRLLKRLGHPDVTVHGFRSAFRDWCGEATNFPREVAEAALAHRVGDAAEQAYRRGTALEKRRRLMEAWANFCSSKPVPTDATVTTFRRAP